MDPFTLILKFLAPNDEHATWAEIQAKWRAFAADSGIELADDREDTWPVTRRTLGTHEGLTLVIGIRGHAEAYLEADDPKPLESLTCDVGPAAPLAAFTFRRVETGDAAFDERFTVCSADDAGARMLLGDDLRRALSGGPSLLHLRYDRGHVRYAWDATRASPADLVGALDVVVAASRRAPTGPYR